MGIKGLTSFLDDNFHLLTKIKIRDTKVIIDGNNLFHFLYSLYNLWYEFGGDYDCFAASSHAFFRTLAQCNIEPIVVFDGPYNPKEKKILTSIRRAKQRIDVALSLANGRGGRATPILCHDVFLSVVEELQIEHVTCEDEADSEIAALANTYGCPVMTNDSDFFIYNLTGGVILLDYVDLRMKSDKDPPADKCKNYFLGQIYHFSKFHQTFKMDADMIALFATMLGNEKVEAKTLEPFFENVQFPRNSTRFVTGGTRTRIQGLLLWLENYGTLDEGVQSILKQFKVDERETLKRAIMESVNAYKCISRPSTAAMDPSSMKIRTYTGREVPLWFLEELRKGKVGNFVANSLVSRKAILSAQPEWFVQSSAHDCAKLLRRITYGIIVRESDTNEGEPIRALRKNIVSIMEIDRDGRNQKCTSVEAQLELNGEPLPSLAQVPSLDEAERLRILCYAHGVRPEDLSNSPRGSELYMMTIVHWINHAEPRLDWLQVSTVVTCLLKCTALDPPIRSSNSTKLDTSQSQQQEQSENGIIDEQAMMEMFKSSSLNEIVTNNCTEELVQAVKDKLSRFLQPAAKVKSKNLLAQCEPVLLHGFAQLQACILASQALNQVLGNPLPRISIATVYNGTFLFCLYQELKLRSGPDGFLYELLNRCPILTKAHQTFINLVKKSLKDNVLVYSLSRGTKKAKRSKRKKKKVKICDSDSGDSEPEKENLVANCDLNNKFDCLLLGDAE